MAKSVRTLASHVLINKLFFQCGLLLFDVNELITVSLFAKIFLIYPGSFLSDCNYIIDIHFMMWVAREEWRLSGSSTPKPPTSTHEVTRLESSNIRCPIIRVRIRYDNRACNKHARKKGSELTEAIWR